MKYASTPQSIMRILLALWCGAAVCVALTNPLGEAPDEPAHFDYVRFLVQAQRLPVQCTAACVSDVPGEGHQPPLAYAIAALVTWPLFEHTEWVPQALNPHFIWHGGSDAQALIHGTREQWPWHGTFLAWRLVRLVSVIWVAIGLWLVWRSALALSTPSVALSAVALLSISPQLALLGGSVSNDALLFVLSALCVYLMITVHTTRGMVMMGVVIAMALITKQSAIVLIPTMLWPLWRLPSPWHRIQASGLIILVCMTIAGWWYLRNYTLYGDVFGLSLFRQTYQHTTLDLSARATWREAWQQVMRSAWGVYGWMTITAPRWWYLLTSTLTIATIAGMVLAYFGQHHRLRAIWWGLGSLIGITAAWLLSFAITVGSVAWQARLATPALPALAILMAVGVVHGLQIRLSPRLLIVGTCLLALCQQWIWWQHVLPRFPLQMPAATLTARVLDTPVEAVFAAPTAGGGIALLDYTVAGDLVPGNTITVTLRWQAVTRAPIDWSVFIWLVNQQKQAPVQLTLPLYPMISTTSWSPGDRVYSQHQLALPADLPAGDYTIQIGLVDPLSGMRAHRRTNAEKFIGDSVRIPFTVVH